MLQNPDPADWLHWRRTLDGWGYSPLDEINRDNVYQLQLVWSWQMRPGLSQPTPLVYNGVMYLPNPDGFVQAVDAVTGDQLWEYRKIFDNTPDESFRNRMRSLAIYGTNLYVTTADAHLIALDATTDDNGVGPCRRRSSARLPVHKRCDCRQGCDRRRHHRMRALQERRLFHLRTRPRHRSRALADIDHCRTWNGRR